MWHPPLGTSFRPRSTEPRHWPCLIATSVVVVPRSAWIAATEPDPLEVSETNATNALKSWHMESHWQGVKARTWSQYSSQYVFQAYWPQNIIPWCRLQGSSTQSYTMHSPTTPLPLYKEHTIFKCKCLWNHIRGVDLDLGGSSLPQAWAGWKCQQAGGKIMQFFKELMQSISWVYFINLHATGNKTTCLTEG